MDASFEHTLIICPEHLETLLNHLKSKNPSSSLAQLLQDLDITSITTIEELASKIYTQIYSALLRADVNNFKMFQEYYTVPSVAIVCRTVEIAERIENIIIELIGRSLYSSVAVHTDPQVEHKTEEHRVIIET